MKTETSLPIDERDQWRARILRALAELRGEGAPRSARPRATEIEEEQRAAPSEA